MGVEWANPDALRLVLTILAGVPFLLFATAGMWHFAGGFKSGTGLVSLASLVAFGLVLNGIWTEDSGLVRLMAGVTLQVASLFLFGWCIGTSGRKNLGLALNENASKNLITSGPYALVRHPFYTCYILFWLGGLAIAPSAAMLLATGILIAIYVATSRKEDRLLAQIFDGQFKEWHRRTGAFLPRWH